MRLPKTKILGEEHMKKMSIEKKSLISTLKTTKKANVAREDRVGSASAAMKHPSPVVKHPSPVVKHPSPVVKHPSPVVKHPSPVVKHPSKIVRHASVKMI